MAVVGFLDLIPLLDATLLGKYVYLHGGGLGSIALNSENGEQRRREAFRYG